VLLILVVILLSQVELSQVRAPFFVYDTAKKPDRGESARLTVTTACGWAESRQCFLDQIVHLERESSNLMCLRNTLLAELLSRRVRVPEARDAVEEAVG
jgi:hypothetical protein